MFPTPFRLHALTLAMLASVASLAQAQQTTPAAKPDDGTVQEVTVTATRRAEPSSGLAGALACWAWARLATEASMASVRA